MSVAQLDLFGRPIEAASDVGPPDAPGRTALCQDLDQLRAITAYTYDFRNTQFRWYCHQRGVYYFEPDDDRRGPWGRYYADTTLGLDDFLRDESARRAQVWEGTRVIYSDQDMREFWNIIQIHRGKLQDAWDLWRAAEDNPSGG